MDENGLPSEQTPLKTPVISQNSVGELIEIQKKNTELLGIIAKNQTFLLGLAQENSRNVKMNRWFVVLKYVFWIVMIYLSFVFTQNIIQNMMDKMPNVGGGMDVLNSLGF
jgi:hypothetical protein